MRGYRILIRGTREIDVFDWVGEMVQSLTSLVASLASNLTMNWGKAESPKTLQSTLFQNGVQRFSHFLKEHPFASEFLPNDVCGFDFENEKLHKIAFGSDDEIIESCMEELRNLPSTTIPHSIENSANELTRMCFAVLLKFTRSVNELNPLSKKIQKLYLNARILGTDILFSRIVK